MTNREIAQVFMLYSNAVIVHPLHATIDKCISYCDTMATWFSASEFSKKEPSFWANRRLVLHLIDDITDEHAIHLSKVALPDECSKPLWSVETGKEIAHTIKQGYDLEGYYPEARMTDALLYLISNNYAVPLWFAYGHPENGKTAIELGHEFNRIAIDAKQLKS